MLEAAVEHGSAGCAECSWFRPGGFFYVGATERPESGARTDVRQPASSSRTKRFGLATIRHLPRGIAGWVRLCEGLGESWKTSR